MTLGHADRIYMPPEHDWRGQRFGISEKIGDICPAVTIRKTFIFDENGILTKIIEKVDTKNHAEQILG